MASCDGPEAKLPQLLTTKEVADLLRVKERKVYDMAAMGEIPHRRLTGKLLFPAEEITAWLSGGQGPRPSVIAGSHDPLLDWAVRESGCGLSVLFDGSMDGLRRFQKGEVACAGLHVPEAHGWNLEAVEGAELRDAVLVSWAVRRQGLILRSDEVGGIFGLGGLGAHKWALRQPGAGSRSLFEKLAREAGLSVPSDGIVVRTENEAAQAVSSGDADVALGLEAAAAVFGLSFLPLAEEQFDLLVDRRAYFTQPLQALMAFAAAPEFHEKAAKLGGYDIASLGQVRWLSE